MTRLVSGFLLLFFALPARAQFHVDGTATVGTSGGAYKAPVVRVQLEPRFDGNGWTVGAQFYGIPTGKIDTRDGFTVGTRAEFVVNTRAWMWGGGGAYGYTQTSLYSKHAAHPYVLGGYDFGADGRFFIRYFLPYGDTRNGLHGAEWGYEWPLPKHLSVRLLSTLYAAHPTDSPHAARAWNASVAGGVVWHLR